MKNLIKRTALTTLLVATCTLGAMAFEDVQTTDWYYESVTQMAEQGYITGDPDGNFRPEDSVTYAEYATMVSKAFLGESLKTEINDAGFIQAVQEEKGFSEADVSYWWTPYVVAVGMDSGWNGTQALSGVQITLNDIEFQVYVTLDKWNTLVSTVDNDMTRYDMIMAIDSLYMYAGLTSYDDIPFTGVGELETARAKYATVYKDYPTNDTNAMNAIARLSEMGILQGNSDGTLNLYSTVTRAEMATMLQRLYQDDVLRKVEYTTVAEVGAYDMTKYTVPADFNLDGILTEDEVQQMLDQLQEEFPQGSYLGDAIFPSDGYLPLGSAGYAWTAENDGIYYESDYLGAGGDCIAWAYYVSDRIFGNLPARKISAGEWVETDVRVGDIIDIGHYNVATTKGEWDATANTYWYTTTDSGSAHEIVWGDQSSKSGLTYKISIGTLITRYPA